MRRMEHWIDAVQTSINDNEEEDTMIPIPREHERELPLKFRRARPIKWSNSSKAYLRYMKLVCLELAIWTPTRGSFEGVNK